ncbi:phage tail tape measure protein [Sulfuritalea sp.]|uniref:phage tail tape measure protein n=2 Tax=Betaproteobacteria TaxID=28216 RepID=UPI001AC70669|nr:phage tail tape measure protein [Sulfuritalea sp.]MBN8473162.1 phage tail tape measure protein [Sulfuritalea sp.]
MQRAFNEATKDARNLAATASRLQEKKQGLRHEMSALGIDTKKVADYQRDLKARIDAATGAVDHQSKAMDALGKRQQAMHAAKATYDKQMAMRDKLAGAGTKAMGVGAAFNAAAAVPVIAYAKAEDAATQLKVAMLLKGGKISDDFEKINALAGKLGNRLPGTTSDFQDMMTMLIRQGMPARALLGGLGEATAYLAVQLKMAPTAAAEFASKLQDATRTADKDMMGLMDTIQRTFYLGVDSNNMLEAFKGLGPVMDMIKQRGLEGTNALAPFVVMMDQAGMRGESAGNAIRKVVSKSLDVDKIKKVTDDLMKEKGIRLKLDFTNGKGEFGGIERMMGELAKLKNFNTVQRIAILKDLYGDDKETNEVLSKIIEKGMDGYRDVQARMAAQAEIQERVNLQLKTLNNLWDAASGTFTNALVAFGESISPELHAAAEWLGELAEKTQSWVKENPGLAGGMMQVVKWTGLAALVLGGALVAFSAIIIPMASLKLAMAYLNIQGFGLAAMLGKIGSLFPLVVKGLLIIGRAMLANPLGLLITGALLIYTYWEPIRKFFDSLWSGVAAAFNLASAEFKTWWAETSTWFASLPAKLMEIGAFMMEGLANGIKSGWKWVKESLGGLAKLMPGYVEKPLDVRSPSRVFERIGGYTMAGLQEGIEAARKGPLGAIADAARLLAAAGAGIVISGSAAGALPVIDTRPPLAVAGQMGSGSGSSPYFNFNIYAAPGMDERALAQAVRREFLSLEYERSAQRRGRLTDLE